MNWKFWEKKKTPGETIQEIKKGFEPLYLDKISKTVQEIPIVIEAQVDEGTKDDMIKRLGYRSKWIKIISEMIPRLLTDLYQLYKESKIYNVQEMIGVETPKSAVEKWEKYKNYKIEKGNGLVLDTGSFPKGTHIDASDVGLVFFINVKESELDGLWESIKAELNRRTSELGITTVNFIDKAKLRFCFSDGDTQIDVSLKTPKQRKQYYENIKSVVNASEQSKKLLKRMKSFTKLMNQKTGFNLPTSILEKFLLYKEDFEKMLQTLYMIDFKQVHEYFPKKEDKKLWDFYRIIYYEYYNYLQKTKTPQEIKTIEQTPPPPSPGKKNEQTPPPPKT